jgi:hypothetical protein
MRPRSERTGIPSIQWSGNEPLFSTARATHLPLEAADGGQNELSSALLASSARRHSTQCRLERFSVSSIAVRRDHADASGFLDGMTRLRPLLL